MSILGRIYNTPLKRILEIIGLDYQSRSGYRRYREWKSGVRTIEVSSTSGRFADHTLIADQYLRTELNILDDLFKEIQSDDVFYDIGADAGLYTVFVTQKNPNGCSIAFEPHPLRRESLRRNLDRNGVSATIRTEALSNESGKAELSYGLHSAETNELSETDTGEFLVKVDRADQLIPDEIPPPNIMKIDVEGAELDVLRGFGNILSELPCRVIYIELHDKITNFGGSKHELFTMLHQNGYDTRELFYRKVEQNTELFIKATKTTT